MQKDGILCKYIHASSGILARKQRNREGEKNLSTRKHHFHAPPSILIPKSFPFNISVFFYRSLMRPFLMLLHEFDKGLLVHQASILAIALDTHVAQPKLYEALVYKVYGGVDIQCHGCLDRNNRYKG